MTRTELVHIAMRIVKNPLDTYKDAQGKGTIYTGLYLKRSMSVFVTNKSRVIAVSYCGVCYFVNSTDRKTAPRMRSFCDEHDVKQKVYLYPEAERLLADADGIVNDPVSRKISGIHDYEDVIPIPFNPSNI